jgi:hypothetical protein
VSASLSGLVLFARVKGRVEQGDGTKRGTQTCGDLAAGGRHCVSCTLVATVAAAVLLAGLLVFGLGGCGGVDEGDPTSGLSTATTSGGSAGTLGGGSTGDGQTGGVGTRLDPIPLGREAQVGDWKVKVVGAALDATQAVLDENMFNDPPDSGSQYVLISVEASYVGQATSTFWIDMLYSFVGSEGKTFSLAAAVAPDPITNAGEASAGGAISGNLVFMVASDQIPGGTLMLEEAFAWDKGRVFFAVD